MHREQIKAAIRMIGVTPAMIAEELNISQSAVTSIIAGRSTSARVQNYIAKLIDKPVNEIWPTQPNKGLQRMAEIRKQMAS